MLPTFVIGLREGVEASLIVGHRRRLPAPAAAIGCAPRDVGRRRPRRRALRRRRRGLQVARREAARSASRRRSRPSSPAVAVGMVTFMIVWMREPRPRPRGGAARKRRRRARAPGRPGRSSRMAFLAVLREGIETAVFLLAAFQASGDATAAGLGAALGIVVAVVIGFGIYRGGVRLNLGRFFRVTGRRARAGRRRSGRERHPHRPRGGVAQQPPGQRARPELARAPRHDHELALLTGVLGIQPQPTVGEAFGWLLYAVPMLAFVLLAASGQAPGQARPVRRSASRARRRERSPGARRDRRSGDRGGVGVRRVAAGDSSAPKGARHGQRSR